MRFAVKHTVAAGVVVSGIVAFTAASYFALLMWSVLAGLPLGGPFAFPFMVLFALVACVVAVLFLILPATVIAEWLCNRYHFRLAMQIPTATVVMGILLCAMTAALTTLAGSPMSAGLPIAGIASIVLLVLLGAYWWSMQSVDWLVTAIDRFLKRMR
jgi:hypothetical protein